MNKAASLRTKEVWQQIADAFRPKVSANQSDCDYHYGEFLFTGTDQRIEVGLNIPKLGDGVTRFRVSEARYNYPFGEMVEVQLRLVSLQRNPVRRIWLTYYPDQPNLIIADDYRVSIDFVGHPAEEDVSCSVEGLEDAIALCNAVKEYYEERKVEDAA